mmetsp:Transcript_23508/g.80798  ORF Transcript_23508/g.80798 Transcript_23508/m.80798 type:complete len:254 (-) Transcript_23508:1467-2228(-)
MVSTGFAAKAGCARTAPSWRASCSARRRLPLFVRPFVAFFAAAAAAGDSRAMTSRAPRRPSAWKRSAWAAAAASASRVAWSAAKVRSARVIATWKRRRSSSRCAASSRRRSRLGDPLSEPAAASPAASRSRAGKTPSVARRSSTWGHSRPLDLWIVQSVTVPTASPTPSDASGATMAVSRKWRNASSPGAAASSSRSRSPATPRSSSSKSRAVRRSSRFFASPPSTGGAKTSSSNLSADRTGDADAARDATAS